jgi:hypothetical protein
MYEFRPKMMFMLRKLLGIPSFSRLSLVTRFWDSITKSEWGRELDHDFLVSDSDWDYAIKKGSHYFRCTGDRDSAIGIHRSVIDRSRTIMLKSQQGIADQGLELAETSAIKMADQAMQVNRLLAEYTTVQDDTSARTLLLS